LGNSTVLVVALVAALSIGTATAAKLITGAEIKNHSITGKDIKKRSLPLSVLRQPAAGAPGEKGEVGPRGERGLTGATGPEGASPFHQVFAVDRPIEASIAPDPDPQFIGKPVLLELFVREQGSIQSTVAVGTTGGPIDDPSKFAIQTCFRELGDTEISVLTAAEEGEDSGISPVLADRTAVAVEAAFVLLPGEGETPEEEATPFLVELGPCVTNTTAIPLDDNGRMQASFLVSSL
jgi:hypothetical protein